MTFEFVLPTVVAIAVVCAMGLVDWRLRPRLALPLLSAAMGIAAAAALVVVVGAAIGFALGPARSSALLEWCRVIPLHHRVDPVPGIASIAAITIAGWRISTVLCARRRAVGSVESDARISIVECDEHVAHAVPTRTGCVVVSTGLLAALSPAERRAVFAHERAHLQLGHHRHILLAEVCVAVVPFLRPLADQLRHATERAADETAATLVADRSIVARAIGAAALGPAPVGALGMGGGSVPRRVEALLWPERERIAGIHMSAIAAGAALMAGAALGLQLHHFGELIDHLCNGSS